MEVTRTFDETRDGYHGRIGLLPTLGYFHEGHLRLMDILRETCDTLVVSLFVNPTQFNEEEDFAAYPRDEQRDADLAREHGTDLLFAPQVEEVYPGESVTTVEVMPRTSMPPSSTMTVVSIDRSFVIRSTAPAADWAIADISWEIFRSSELPSLICGVMTSLTPTCSR